ncbi:hypothetical protein WUBG_17264 [Wuchereria bancrofti]|uniref:Uncharacterized protein n=1 Tax=Wuchereria bancrofti TaxID=6293 RepID=J9E4D9_WUCBA|nr:hypothetical protein WUBG_17264 [Wuchereria bancrofti]
MLTVTLISNPEETESIKNILNPIIRTRKQNRSMSIGVANDNDNYYSISEKCHIPKKVFRKMEKIPKKEQKNQPMLKIPSELSKDQQSSSEIANQESSTLLETDSEKLHQTIRKTGSILKKRI